MTRAPRSEWSWLWAECRPFVPIQAQSLVFIVASSTCGMAPPLLMRWLIDDVLVQARWNALGIVTILFLVVMATRVSLGSIGGLLNTLGVQRMICRTRTRLLRHVQSLSAEFYAHRSVGDLVQCIERDVMLVGELGSDILPTLVRIIAGLIMSMAVMIYLDWRVASIVVPLLPLLAYVRHRYRAILQRGAEAVREAAGRQSSLLHEVLTGAIQIQLLGAEDRTVRRYAHLSLKTMQQVVVHRRHELMFGFVSMLIIGLAMALVTGYSGVRVLQGSLTTGGLVAFVACVESIFMPINTAVDLYARSNKVRASIRRLMEIEHTGNAIADPPALAPAPVSPRVVTCTGISFDYAPGQPALRSIDFDVRIGERVAIVGESGCGKSSLLKLIPRLYEPNAGRIAIDGRDIRTFPLRSLRRVISLVPQEPILFQGTVRDNVRYGAPTATQEEMTHVAHIACLTDVIEKLPRGWDTPLGPLGTGLSGGEKQRLAIARALLQRRPILILDEATSALDDLTEHQLLSRLTGWASGRAVILVSHRLAAARWADRVVVLSGGEVVEDDTHDRLYRPDTRYGALWRCRTSVSDDVIAES